MFNFGRCPSLGYISEQNSKVGRNSSGRSTLTERIETRNEEEYRRSACEDLTCYLSICVIFGVFDSVRLLLFPRRKPMETSADRQKRLVWSDCTLCKSASV
jgi:hypothetical protein